MFSNNLPTKFGLLIILVSLLLRYLSHKANNNIYCFNTLFKYVLV